VRALFLRDPLPVVSVRLHVCQGAELYSSHTSRIRRRLRPSLPYVLEFLLRKEGFSSVERVPTPPNHNPPSSHQSISPSLH
jgi:hypothetical protein